MICERCISIYELSIKDEDDRIEKNPVEMLAKYSQI